MKNLDKTTAAATSSKQGQELVRLYVQIRQDLEFRMLKLIYQVKTDPRKKQNLTGKGRVTKRTIVEKALEEYFAKRGI
ncbi:MAG: hypothetical protein JRJ12_01315 [Deltaproteobacteria bacterium]|nr:hypothetical protein [Deltaproteobacteria bacterium]MBW2072455.1 hypothetical protein [Deltaproteobacteria bacterium]